MSVPRTLSTAPFEHPALDYAFLRQAGIQHLERMAGQLWTDFNTHDPGITILEQLCYALTDLAHRIEYPLPDLLTGAGQDAYASLYGPAQILTTQPVTLNDLRKLVIDVEGVKNAWIEKVETSAIALYFDASKNALSLQGGSRTAEPIALQGLVRVLIEVSDLLYIDGTAEQREEVQRAVTRRLHENRSLGEDFVAIQLLEVEEIGVEARIEIEAVEEAEAILLALYQRIADSISPPVRFYTLRQCLEAGKQIDEIFEGPLLEHGFIDTAELQHAQRRTALRTSDLIREIMSVPGVRAVRTITLSKGGKPEAWSLPLHPDKTPKLKLENSNLRLERNGLAAKVDIAKVRALYAAQLRHTDDDYRRIHEEWELQPPPGRDRHVGNYYSIQHQFPATYGIGTLGLPDSAAPQRKAQAQQLKAYLLFFDQLLANYFAQLAHVQELFSFSARNGQTYFSQPVADARLGLDEVRRLPLPQHEARLRQITEQPLAMTDAALAEATLRRHSRFLNHLLARFAEQFTDYSLLLYGVTPVAAGSAAAKLVQDQQAFLQAYVQVSSARGTAFNYLQPWEVANHSGLEKRIKHKLGLVEANGEFFYLVEHILLRPMEGDAQQEIPLLASPPRKDPYSLQLSFVFPQEPPRFADDGFKEFVERTVREETPAHLVSYILWLEPVVMSEFVRAYQAWLEHRRSYWVDKFGV